MSDPTPVESAVGLSWARGETLPPDPAAPQTLWEVLTQAAAAGRSLITIDADGAAQETSYDQLRQQALRIAAGLHSAGVRPGDKVLLQLDGARLLTSLWGCLAAGATAAPLAIPPVYRDDQPAAARLHAAWRTLGRPTVVADSSRFDAMSAWTASTGDSWRLVRDDMLGASRPLADGNPAAPGDTALVLFTSGSSGAPKGVLLSHANLLAMSAGAARMNDLGPSDTTLNWLPLDHVGALAFLHVLPVFLGCRQIHVATPYVLRQPLRWLDLLDQYRATVSWAPNFAFDLIERQKTASPAPRVDLSCVRMLVSAGEPVSLDVLARFWRRFAPWELPARSLCPAFGMSETASGITWGSQFDISQHRAETDTAALGKPIAGAELRIVDANGQVVPQGQPGRLQVRGPSVAANYLTDAGLQELGDREGWFTTGDLAALRDGQLHITGREKEVIILRGMHYHGHELEQAVEAVPGIMAAHTAACDVRLSQPSRTGLAIFFVPERATIDASLPAEIRRAVRERTGVTPDVLIALRREQVPKSSIGKIERQQLRSDFEAGRFVKEEILAATDGQAKLGAAGDGGAAFEGAIARIWCEVLVCEQVGRDDNFFDVGGTSVLLAQLEESLRTQLGLTVSPADLLSYATIRAQAEFFQPPSASATPERQLITALNTTTSPRPAASTTEESAGKAVAIIGMACRLPGARDIGAFWQNLRAGRESIETLSDVELAEAGVPLSQRLTGRYVNRTAWLDDIDRFDAALFGYRPDEARRLDPQQRQFLECAYEALEDAACDPKQAALRVGVFGTAGVNLYARRCGAELELDGDFETELLASAGDFLAPRVSYKLDLRGPSLTIQTACSSSLVCVHLACRSLQVGDCDVALAGGASLWTLRRTGYVHHPGGLTSPDGRCRAFSAAANGMVFGNGVGVVVLKPLAQALADGDAIYAVIRGSAINNDGAGKAGFMATGAVGQGEVIASALSEAELAGAEIDYVECHGTGTLLGDAVEYAGLTRGLGDMRGREAPCWIGSVKTNVGHLGVAGGIAGLIKTALAVQYGELPASLHCDEPNPHIDFQRGPFRVNTMLRRWQGRQNIRRAGVSSFGLGGTNAHVVLESPPAAHTAPVETAPAETGPAEKGPALLLLSAQSPAALERASERLALYLQGAPQTTLTDVAYTLAIGRRKFAYRRAIVAQDLADASRQLGQASQRAGRELPLGEYTPRTAQLTELGHRWEAGETLDWTGLFGTSPRQKLHLPTYAFQRERHWIDRPPSLPASSGGEKAVPLVRPPAPRRNDGDRRGWLERLLLAASPADRQRLVVERIGELVADVLRLPADTKVDPDHGFLDLGLTSLSAVELIRALEVALDATLAVTLILEHATPRQLAAHLADTRVH